MIFLWFQVNFLTQLFAVGDFHKLLFSSMHKHSCKDKKVKSADTSGIMRVVSLTPDGKPVLTILVEMSPFHTAVYISFQSNRDRGKDRDIIC